MKIQAIVDKEELREIVANHATQHGLYATPEQVKFKAEIDAETGRVTLLVGVIQVNSKENKEDNNDVTIETPSET